MSEEEKNFLINQANMYLNGKSFREIAKEVGQSHVTVRDNITQKIRLAAPDIYRKVQDKISENSEKTIKDPEVRKRVLTAYKLLVEENKTVLEIADILDTTEFVIYRDLTKRLVMLNEMYPSLVTNDMLRLTKYVLQKHAGNNPTNVDNSVNIKVLYEMFPKQEKRYRFIARCALTFGLRLDSLSEILGYDPETIRYKLYGFYPEREDSMTILFCRGMREQTRAKNTFFEYLNSLYTAYLNRKTNKEMVDELLEVLSDKDAKAFMKKREKDKTFTEEDTVVLLKFQLKYLLSATAMGTYFKMDRGAYCDRVRKLKDKYPEELQEFEQLCDYYNKPYVKHYRGY